MGGSRTDQRSHDSSSLNKQSSSRESLSEDALITKALAQYLKREQQHEILVQANTKRLAEYWKNAKFKQEKELALRSRQTFQVVKDSRHNSIVGLDL